MKILPSNVRRKIIDEISDDRKLEKSVSQRLAISVFDLIVHYIAPRNRCQCLTAMSIESFIQHKYIISAKFIKI